MNIGFLITVRLKSKRLRKKVILPLNGFSVIERVIQRAKKTIENGKIILCTSNVNQDLPLVDIAIKNNVYYYNGDPEDVLSRLLSAAKFFNLDYFIGMTADNPLFSIEQGKKIKELFKKKPYLDYVFTSGLPLGVNIYGIKTLALETVCAFKKQIDTEIWGPLINRPEIFNIKEIKINKDLNFRKLRLTLDQKEDYELINNIYNNFEEKKIIRLIDIINFLNKNKKISQINSNVVQRELSSDITNEIDQFVINNKEKILKLKNKIYK